MIRPEKTMVEACDIAAHVRLKLEYRDRFAGAESALPVKAGQTVCLGDLAFGPATVCRRAVARSCAGGRTTGPSLWHRTCGVQVRSNTRARRPNKRVRNEHVVKADDRGDVASDQSR